jgi:acylphosphatase
MHNGEYWHAAIRGRVQKVGFRWFVMKNAERLGIAGWVRNNPDGTVELEASGPADAMVEFRERVSQGPATSRVEHVYDLPTSSDPLPRPFEVR